MKIYSNEIVEKEKGENSKIDYNLLKDMEYVDILFVISKKLVQYSDENHLKQEDLAKKIGVSQVMVSKMESGSYNFTVKSLVNLCNKLSDKNKNFGKELLDEIQNVIDKNSNFKNVH